MTKRRILATATLVSALILILLPAIGTNAQSSRKRAVDTPDAPKAMGPYSQAIVANGVVYTAGQLAIDPRSGLLISGGIEEQTEQVLKNLEAVLNAAGSSIDDVVKTTIVLADIGDFAKMNEVYGKRFTAPFPARSTLEAARLPKDARIMIEAVAIVRQNKRAK